MEGQNQEEEKGEQIQDICDHKFARKQVAHGVNQVQPWKRETTSKALSLGDQG